MSRRVLIVDGYNVIGALSILRAERLASGREALVQRLSRYAQVRGHQVIVVFDGASAVRQGSAQRSHPGVQVLFSGSDEKADPVIVRLARERRGECVVVSDDHGVRRPCDHAGAVVLHCEELDRVLERSEREPVCVHPQEPSMGHRQVAAPTLDRPESASAPARVSCGNPSPAPARSGGTVAALTVADLDAWAAFASEVVPLPVETRPVAAPARPVVAPMVSHVPHDAVRVQAQAILPDPDPSTPVSDDPWFVPDSVIEAKDADEETHGRADRGPSRDERRRQNIIADL